MKYPGRMEPPKEYDMDPLNTVIPLPVPGKEVFEAARIIKKRKSAVAIMSG